MLARMRKLLLCLTALAAASTAEAQSPPTWPNGKVAGPTLIAYVERVRAPHGLGVLQFHGTGGDYLEVSAAAHQALIDHLRNHPGVWVAPFQEVMDYVAARPR
jgi:peptidoglycan-N-acetylglucosamine deacetylase